MPHLRRSDGDFEAMFNFELFDHQDGKNETREEYGPDELKSLGKSLPHSSRFLQCLHTESEDSVIKWRGV